MKYRKCLWCGDYFWAMGCEKTCCDDCRKRRTAELAKKSRQKRLAREARIRAKIANEKNKGGISCSITPNS